MFYLWHEEFDVKHPKFRIVKYQKDLGMQQYAVYESLQNVINQSFSYPEYNHYFLLDDSRFHFFRFDIFKELDRPFTIDDINEITHERLCGQYFRQLRTSKILDRGSRSDFFPFVSDLHQ